MKKIKIQTLRITLPLSEYEFYQIDHIFFKDSIKIIYIKINIPKRDIEILKTEIL